MRNIGYTAPYDKPNKNKLIENGLIKEWYEISISFLEFNKEFLIICAYSRSSIYLPKMYNVIPYRKDKKKYRKSDTEYDRILSEFIFVIYWRGPDIYQSHREYQYRSDNKRQSIDPWSLNYEYSTHSVTDKVLDCIGLTFEIKRFKYEWIELMKGDHWGWNWKYRMGLIIFAFFEWLHWILRL